MIVDREGDLVLTDEDNLLRLDVGGFLMLATGEEIEQRMPQRQALRYRQMDRAGFKLVPVRLGPRWRMEPARVLPWVNIPVVQFMPGEPLPEPVMVVDPPTEGPTYLEQLVKPAVMATVKGRTSLETRPAFNPPPLPPLSMQTLEEAALLLNLGLSVNEVRERLGLPPLEISPSPEPTESPQPDCCVGR